MTAQPALDIEDLIVDRVSGRRRFRLEVPVFKLGNAEVVALVGPSGSGKSTLLDVLSLILQPTNVAKFVVKTTKGEVIDLTPVLKGGFQSDLDRMRLSNIGYVMQTGGLLPFLTAEANVSLTGQMAGLSATEARKRTYEIGKRLGVAKLMKDRPSRLSVGERQRVAIARALCHSPSVVLADEPTAALDTVTGHRVLGLFLELAASTGTSLICATHDTELLDHFGLPRAFYHQDEIGPDQVRATFSFEGAR